jgi:hypothetical protein
MADYESLLPYGLMKSTLVLELVAFLTSHMVDSRSVDTLHEGLFQRCIYPTKLNSSMFNCLWWSADTFNSDRSKPNFLLYAH